jgi:hypothetical protein
LYNADNKAIERFAAMLGGLQLVHYDYYDELYNIIMDWIASPNEVTAGLPNNTKSKFRRILNNF